MSDHNTLDIFLYDQFIGSLVNLPGDKNLVSFSESYINNPHRSVLSLSFKDVFGDLITSIKTTRTRLPPFFSNLLPEGHMREYLAQQAKTNPQREFHLLSLLGQDLPGALKVIPSNREHSIKPLKEDAHHHSGGDDGILHFSLAGVQLKFSAVMERDGGLTIPSNGVGGSWIVKLPSATYPGVPENEYTMMELARRTGIEVPEIALVPIHQIHGLPKGIEEIANHAFIIKRFDRSSDGQGIHIEDFAQVFGVFPEKKYQFANYSNIAQVIHAEIGEAGIIEFIRRFVFNALIGNGDMHLKNWSLIYPDKVHAKLAPAYDFVSTIPYIRSDLLALNFMDSKSFESITYEQFTRFAAKALLSEKLILATVKESVEAFRNAWKTVKDLPLDKEIIPIINQHLKTIPIYKI